MAGAPRIAEPVVADVMQTHFITSPPDARLPDVRQTMRLARLRHLLLVQEDQLVGLVSYRTLLEELLEGREPLFAADVMAADPRSVTPATSLAEAAERLCRYGLGCLPVIDPEGNRLVGLITETDVLRAAFRRRRRPRSARGNGDPAAP